MTRLTTITFLILWALNSFSQEFGTHWICHPTPNDSSEVLFVHTYATTQIPQQAQISFASSGQVKVFVNERNIAPDITFNNADTSSITLQTYDVTRYLNSSSNTIAVWYAPVTGTNISKQLSLEFYGINQDGSLFYHKADKKWICQALKGCYKRGTDETYDARSYNHNWKESDSYKKKWLHPLGAYNDSKQFSISDEAWAFQNTQLQNIIKPVRLYQDSIGVHYDFGREFTGSIRLTLRDARQGETLDIDGFTYICNGELDEQVFRRFTSAKQRVFTIRGDHLFKPSQIMNIEALEYNTFSN